jgi:hypothetical protein
MKSFPNDDLDPAQTGGDLVMACRARHGVQSGLARTRLLVIAVQYALRAAAARVIVARNGGISSRAARLG